MIFLDANFLIALFINDHKYNKRALKIWGRIKDQKLIISNSIILELMTVSNIKIKTPKEILEKVYARLNSGKLEIIEDIPLYDNALKRQISYLPERLSFFDCLYMELMEQLEIKQIVTFDKHFNNKGIEVIGQ
ncbi:MAG: PIN domain-containing protein [Methanobrevibacter sp.]|jgi:predicted nucleic acid-binding protein|nr:PIN domain-containing protein [Candidatus Methanovirga procula]